MSVKLAYNKVEQFADGTGVPYSGAKLFTYVGGSVNTKQTTYTESTGSTPNTNPIVLDSSGRLPQPVWLTTGVSYKFVLAPSTDTDPPASPIWTLDGITGVNDSSASQSEWISGPTPTFVSTTQFTLVGDQTTNFAKSRRLKFTVTAGTVYGTIVASTFVAITTVTVALDSGNLDSGLSAVSYGIIASVNPSISPDMIYRRGAAIAAAATTDIWSIAGDYAHITGGTGISSFGTAPYAGSRRIVIHDGSVTLTNSASLACPDGIDLKISANDTYEVIADTTTAHRIINITRASSPGFISPNLITNSNWQIDQINEGSLYTVSTVGVPGPDGWSGSSVGSGVFKMRTLADPENAALKCLEITCTTADASVSATDDYFIYTAIEGYDATVLMAGTSAAQPITIQFKFKTNVTGIYGISLANSALNRRYIGTINVLDASEHEYITQLILDTTGTWIYTNGVGMYLRICLSAGANFQGTAGVWAAGSEQTTSAQANFMSSTSNIAYLKRIQLIPGNLVQTYRPADIQKELSKAQRYYQKSFSQGTAPVQGLGASSGETVMPGNTVGVSSLNWYSTNLPVVMRTAPTVTFYNPVSANAQARNISTGADTSGTAVVFSNASMFNVNWTGDAGAAIGNRIGVHYTASARLS